jgi:hypothetical protein
MGRFRCRRFLRARLCIPNKRKASSRPVKVTILLTVASLVGCRSDPAEVRSTATTIVVTGAEAKQTGVIASAGTLTASAPLSASTAATSIVTSGAATFKDDVLDNCTDLSIVAKPEKVGQVREDIEKTLRNIKKDSLRVDSCAEAFKDRVVLASCHVEVVAVGEDSNEWTLDRKGEVVKAGGETIQIGIYQYLFETTFESDRAMRECLEAKGKWEALRRDSDEFKRAERDAHTRKLNGLAKKYGQ